MSYIIGCFKSRQLAVNLFYTALVLFSGKSFAREAKRRIKLNELAVTQVTTDYKIHSFHSKVSEFFNTQSNQKTISDLRSELEHNQIKREQEKSWNTTAYNQMSDLDDGSDESLVMKKMERVVFNPFNLEFKTTSKKMFAKKKDKKKETIPQGYLIRSSRHQTREKAEEASTPLNVKLKLRPEQGRGKIALEKGSLRLEADYKVGGGREVASVHTLSSLGVSTKVAYNIINKQTITSVDKTLTEHISTRLTKTSGVKSDNKAEVLYSLSF